MLTNVWEDNEGCLKLAKLEPPRMMPRSKHHALKYHWFRSQIVPNMGIVLAKRKKTKSAYHTGVFLIVQLKVNVPPK